MHITAEIEYLRKKYFRIDGQWFILEDQFLDFMNNDAKLYYQKYRLNTLNLKPWDDSHDEEKYNASYHIEPSAFVLDRIVKDNIELCDVLIFENGTVYLIHVKDGFDAKMRDLYVQLVLSAKRLSNDLKNAKGSTYLRKTLTEYNKRNSLKKIDVDSVVSQMVSGQMKINFVMAFKSNHYKNSTIMEKIDNCKSNIAKYALVQVVKEMQAYNFSINLMDLSEIS